MATPTSESGQAGALALQSKSPSPAATICIDRQEVAGGLDTDHGYIGIQAEGKMLDFRNIRVRELGSEGSGKEK